MTAVLLKAVDFGQTYSVQYYRDESATVIKLFDNSIRYGHVSYLLLTEEGLKKVAERTPHWKLSEDIDFKRYDDPEKYAIQKQLMAIQKLHDVLLNVAEVKARAMTNPNSVGLEKRLD